MLLDGFEEFALVKGHVYILIQSSYIRLSKVAWARLGYSEYVRVLINYDKKVVALVSANKHDRNAVRVDIGNRIIYRSLCNEIKNLCPVNGFGFRVDGKYEQEGKNKVLFFDLTQLGV